MSASAVAFKLPITVRRAEPFEALDAWAQREYARCLRSGIGFSAHGRWWHYFLPKTSGVFSIRFDALDHPCEPLSSLAENPLEWIGHARRVASTAEREGM